MLKVAFVTDAPRIAGSEVWLQTLLPFLPHYDLQPTLFLPQDPSFLTFAQSLESENVKVKFYRKFSDDVFQQCSFDMWVIQAWQGKTYRNVFSKVSRPRLAIVHDPLDYHYPLGFKKLYQAVYFWDKVLALKKADLVITVSKWGAKHLKGMGLDAVTTVQNGVDITRFRPSGSEKERTILRERFGFHRFTTLVPGRFALEKNQVTSIMAAMLAPNIDFVFVGDDDSLMGWICRAITSKYRLSNVRFLGRRLDMPELYRAADAVLQPTLAENQSFVTLEAMASGLPVVTTPIAAQAELIENGVRGLLVPANPKDIAQALNKLAEQPSLSRKLGLAAREYVVKQHTLEASAQALAQTLWSLSLCVSTG